MQNPAGGTFGYKFSPTMEALVGVACMATGRPVFLRYDYQQHITYTGKRSPFWMKVKFGADKDGKLLAMESDWSVDHGPYSEFGDLLTLRGAQFIGAGYDIANIRGMGRTVCTNHAWGSAFRAYGSPQSFLASESLMDELAEKMGMDPLELRYRNVYRPGDTTPTGQAPEVFSFPQMVDMLRPKYKAALEKAKQSSTADVKKRRGHLPGHLRLRPGRSGRLRDPGGTQPRRRRHRLGNSWEDHGQGADMGGLGTAHEALRPLGITPDQIKLVMNDTAMTPDSGPSGGSRQQVMTGNAIKSTAVRLLVDAMRKPDGTYRTYDEMVAENIPVRYDGKWTAVDEHRLRLRTAQGNPFAVYMYGVFMAEVAVDTKTGKTTVEKYTAVADVGKINNKLVVDGQMYGGIAQGIGLALTEDFEDLEKHHHAHRLRPSLCQGYSRRHRAHLRGDPARERPLRRGRRGRTAAHRLPCGRHQRHQQRLRRADHAPAGPAREGAGGSAGATEVATVERAALPTAGPPAPSTGRPSRGQERASGVRAALHTGGAGRVRGGLSSPRGRADLRHPGGRWSLGGGLEDAAQDHALPRDPRPHLRPPLRAALQAPGPGRRHPDRRPRAGLCRRRPRPSTVSCCCPGAIGRSPSWAAAWRASR